jgi:hypothetical protein
MADWIRRKAVCFPKRSRDPFVVVVEAVSMGPSRRAAGGVL